jgi:hypothetical protein
MQLHLLRRTTCLAIYYDFRNDWLYLDWQGHLALPVLQEACLALADCYLHRPYPRVLNNNEQVTGVNWGIALWLVSDFLPHMTLAGVQQVAWVYSPSLQGRSMVQAILSWLPGQSLTSFDDLAGAVEWLTHTRAEQAPGYLLPRRAAADQARLTQEVLALRQRCATAQRKTQRV